MDTSNVTSTLIESENYVPFYQKRWRKIEFETRNPKVAIQELLITRFSVPYWKKTGIRQIIYFIYILFVGSFIPPAMLHYR